MGKDRKSCVVETFEECFKSIENGLAHYTMSHALENIFCKNGLSFMASCFSKYWKEEQTAHDDASEFRGALKRIKWSNTELLSPLERQDIQHMNKLIPSNQRYDAGPDNGKTIGSTLTPYIICFSSEINDPTLYHRFCNPKNGFPVMIRLKTSVLLERGVKVSKEDGIELERQIILPITYYENTSELENKNLINKKAKEINEVVPQYSLGLKTKEEGSSYKNGNCDGDNRIDACLFLKKREYDSEKEVRYVVYSKEEYNFRILQNGEYHFRFKEETEGKPASDKKIFLHVSPECVDSVQFSPCVPYEEAKKIAETVIFSKDAFSDLPVFLFDGTRVFHNS